MNRGVKRIVFAGGGHAHVAALRRLAANPPDAEIVLINEGPKIWYTGALPGLIRGDLTEDQAHIDAAKLAAACNARFIDDRFIDYEGNWINFEQRDPLRFDILSISTGARLDGGIKPIQKFLARVKLWDRVAAPRIGILGGGAAGVEMALALSHRLGPAARIAISAPGGAILPNAPKAARSIARAELRAVGITVAETFATAMDDIIHAYAPEPELRIRPTLQLTTRDNIFAAGDCAAMTPPTPRSGAIAVRQGRVLAHNIRALPLAAPLRDFQPPRSTLAIMTLNADEALAWYGPFAWAGHLPAYVKSRLDAHWLAGGASG